ncbi:D-galactarate dehydratase [Limimaricola sp.]|uniref:D-galactarate dehydratase n=1 Tax=Limimaricola sp. TaxID=2211665 RepID=UPI0025BE978E|nr:D-galactarate dehydratase [Limimaricola sp.]
MGHPPPASAAPVAPDASAPPAAAPDAAAPAPAPAPGQTLGTTLATLGAPGEQGLWVKTPLVSATMQGDVRWHGKTIGVQLRPSGGAAGSGSQISLAAMQLLGAPLTEIVELTVIAGG